MSVINVITIDGPAGSGKSTISRLLAARIGYAYLDTGAMYRAIALAAKRRGISLDNHMALKHLCETLDLHFVADQNPPRLFMENEDISEEIRNPEMDMLSSTVSTVKEVREAMCILQRKISCHVKKGLVAEGRDMGTVVFPDARFKFLLTASLEERASRRHLELLARGKTMQKTDVMDSLKKRDNQDENRALAPLKPAPDAFILDSTGMGVEEVVQCMMNHMASI
ncbi:MAG: (d)CMP kinase [Deltaproteobacteria bacterium]|nr:(d)CMP kinase [Deltaproteobacteria bacterium]